MNVPLHPCITTGLPSLFLIPKPLIKLFGASTEAGKYLKKVYKKDLIQTKLVSFSRFNKRTIYFDLTSTSYPKELLIKEDTILISLAPIWLFVPFLKNYINKNGN